MNENLQYLLDNIDTVGLSDAEHEFVCKMAYDSEKRELTDLEITRINEIYALLS